MSPQLSTSQLKRALENGKKLIAAKELEIEAYSEFRKHAPAALGELFWNIDAIAGVSSDTATTASRLSNLQHATENLFKAKLDRAMVELEELQLQTKGIEQHLKQAESRIALPNLTPR